MTEKTPEYNPNCPRCKEQIELGLTFEEAHSYYPGTPTPWTEHHKSLRRWTP